MTFRLRGCNFGLVPLRLLIGIVLGVARRLKVAADFPLAALEDPFDAREHKLRKREIEKRKDDRQPDQLGAKSPGCSCGMVEPPIALRMAPPFGKRQSSTSEYEEKDERDNETEQAGRFGERKPEKKVRELARSRGRITKRALQEVAEDAADADAGADKGRTGEARANELGCCGSADNSPIQWMG